MLSHIYVEILCVVNGSPASTRMASCTRIGKHHEIGKHTCGIMNFSPNRVLDCHKSGVTRDHTFVGGEPIHAQDYLNHIGLSIVRSA